MSYDIVDNVEKYIYVNGMKELRVYRWLLTTSKVYDDHIRIAYECLVKSICKFYTVDAAQMIVYEDQEHYQVFYLNNPDIFLFNRLEDLPQLFSNKLTRPTIKCQVQCNNTNSIIGLNILLSDDWRKSKIKYLFKLLPL